MKEFAKRNGLIALAGALLVHGVVAAFVLAPDPAPVSGGGVGLVSVSLGQSGAPSAASDGSVETRAISGFQPETVRPEPEQVADMPLEETAEEPVVDEEPVVSRAEPFPERADIHEDSVSEPTAEESKEAADATRVREFEEIVDPEQTVEGVEVHEIAGVEAEIEVIEDAENVPAVVDVVSEERVAPLAPNEPAADVEPVEIVEGVESRAEPLVDEPQAEPEMAQVVEAEETPAAKPETEVSPDTARVSVPPVPLPKPEAPESVFAGVEEVAEVGEDLANTQEEPGADGNTENLEDKAGDGQSGKTEGAGEGGQSDAPSLGGGEPDQKVIDYFVVLQNWLERHKDYPRSAMVREEEGVVFLYFVVARTGMVETYRIHQGSGHDLLDREVLAMIERAQPLPRIPDSLRHERLELVIPIAFSLR